MKPAETSLPTAMNPTDEHICTIALSLCPGIGPTTARRLLKAAGSAADLFARRDELRTLCPDLPEAACKALDTHGVRERAAREMDYAERKGIRCLTLRDPQYPVRLRQCDDAPLYLFYKGNADLNCLRVVSMVGTRHATAYGRQFCESFVRDLAACCPDLLVVSGLAYGIDIATHRAALACRVPTVGVLAHGLDRIYPAAHARTAAQMTEQGGLLTEYLTGTEPERYNFVHRNRIVAGMADALVVVESGTHGGSLITASLAESYGRECFALPGRAGDEHSAGCNRLIRDRKARLVQDAADLVQALNWSRPDAARTPVQRELFQELTADESLVTRLLAAQGDLSINALAMQADLPVHQLSALLFEMEMKGIVKALAGNKYHLLG